MKLPIVSRRELEDALERHESLLAEFQNYKRRTASAETAARLAGENSAFQELLPVYDNLQRALEQSCQDEAFVRGIQMTMDSLLRSMEKLGIQEIPAMSCQFDPRLHEAMEHIEDPELDENTITRVILTGFRRGDTVLRHALVVVAN